MPEVVTIQCPHCKAVLKLKSRAPLGRKIACPRCETPFLARERAAKNKPPVEDYEDYGDPGGADEFDDFGTDDFGAGGFDEPAPRPRKSGTAAGKKRKKSKKKQGMSRGLKIGLIAGGSVLGAVVVGLVIWLVVGMFSSKLDLAWIPPDANRITVTRYSQIWDSKIVQDELSNAAKANIVRMKDEWGFEPRDVLSVTIGSSGLDRIRVVRTAIDLDEDKILKHAGDYEQAEHEGQTYYRFESGAIFFPDKRTAVSGTEESVKKAIERGPKPPQREELKFVNAGGHRVYIRVEDDRMGSFQTVAKVDSWTFTSTPAQLEQFRFDSADEAKEFADGVEEQRRVNREKFQKQIESSSASEEKKRQARELVNSYSISVSRSGDVVTIRSSMSPPSDPELRKKMLRGIRDPVPIITRLVDSPGRYFGIGSTPQPAFPRPGRPGPGGARPETPVPRRPVTTRRNRVFIAEATVRSFRGSGDQAAAAKEALKSVPGVDHERTRVFGETITIYSVRGAILNVGRIRIALTRAGFRSVRVRTKGVE